MKIEIKKVKENAIIPEYKTLGAAGVDLCACIDAPLLLTPETPVLIPTGIALNMGEENIVDRKSTRLNSSHIPLSRMPSSA